MRKTKLMQIAARHSGDDTYANTRLIDNTVYMISDMAESVWGPDFIEAIEDEIMYTQTSLPRKPVLHYLVNKFIADHLVRHLAGGNLSAQAKELGTFKPLNDETQADYFMAFLQIEKDSRGTPLEVAAKELQKILFGYTSETPFAVCQAIVEFFKVMGDQWGCFLLIKKLSMHIKLLVEEDND